MDPGASSCGTSSENASSVGYSENDRLKDLSAKHAEELEVMRRHLAEAVSAQKLAEARVDETQTSLDDIRARSQATVEKLQKTESTNEGLAKRLSAAAEEQARMSEEKSNIEKHAAELKLSLDVMKTQKIEGLRSLERAPR
jgi:chromosome segregation ATPase